MIDDAIRPDLHSVMGGILKTLNCSPVKINSEPDHTHVLFILGRTVTVANTVGEVKSGSTRWIKNMSKDLQQFQWQAGYGAFSVGESMVPQVIRYIENQRIHHQKRTFKDEFRSLCTAYGIRWDERYVWD